MTSDQPLEFGNAYTDALARSDLLRVSALLFLFAATAVLLLGRTLLTEVSALGISLAGPMGVVLFAGIFESIVLVWYCCADAPRMRVCHCGSG